MPKKVTGFDKDFYKKGLIAACNKIINKSDFILEDWDDQVSNIIINISLEPAAIPSVTIIKEHNIVEGERYELN